MFNDSAMPMNMGDGGSGWWFIIVLALLFFGGNGGGFFGGRNASGAAENYVLASDFANISRQIDSQTSELMRQTNQISNGLCDGFYAMNTSLLNAELSRANGQADVQRAISDCCCTTREAIANLNYNLASKSCEIMQNDNNNYRALHDEIVANKIEAKDAQIAQMASQINALQLSASQCAQNAYLINQLRPTPVPAYTVSNPYYYIGGTTIA